MGMSSDRWKEITPSRFPWEREALEYVRRRLPDHDPYRAWSNFEFIAGDGSVNEVDLLVVARNGFFLVEIKSRPGALSGDPGTWVWRDEEGRVAAMDNPLYLANRKAKKLASLLKSRKAFDKIRFPYLDALVFCSAENLTSTLTGVAATHICYRDPDNGRPTGRPGIMGALINRNAPGLKPHAPPISKPMAAAIGRALDQVGVRPSRKLRQVGDYRLDSLLFQHPGDVWQDWKAAHVITEKITKRVRIYNISRAESRERRELVYKAARREFQLLNQLRCDGILNAEVFTDHELGPAMVYPYYPGAERLDHYLRRRFSTIGVDIKLSLIRRIAEAVKYAHGKGVLHRALSPCSILVKDPGGARPRIKILDWQAGRALDAGADSASSTRSSGTIHPDRLMEDASLLYMSPEGLNRPEAQGERMDVFSLGAVAYHIFTGRPPAATPMDLSRKLKRSAGLDISLALDGAGKELRELIQYSTNPDLLNRYESAEDFLEQLQLVEDEFTEPDEEVVDNPLDAAAGDRLEGGFLVKERLGRGGSATVFLVKRGQGEAVLKLANRPELNDRLKREYDLLRNDLRHPRIVEPYEEVKISGLAGFTMRRAGEETLARLLRREGAPQLEFLKRYGEDLLEIVAFLEDQGVYHRDVKPENIGVGPAGKKGKKRLFLFDFSLARSSLDNIGLGTPRYHDPFISLRRPVRWDVYDERFTAAMTLHEMAAGVLPTWGDGQSDPALTDGGVHIASESLDAAIRGPMTAFFTRAFQRRVEERFDNAEEMLNAWKNVFRDIDRPGTVSSRHDEPFDQAAAIAAAEPDARLISLGLSPQALAALERMNILTVRELLDAPFHWFRRMRGVGINTRNEVVKFTHDLHRAHPDHEPGAPGPGTAPGPEVASVDLLAREIDRAGAKSVKPLLRAFLGLERAEELPWWPGRRRVVRSLGMDPAEALTVFNQARTRWQKTPAVTRLRQDIPGILAQCGGVMGAPDLCAAVLASRGSVQREPRRTRLAVAACRAALEAERGVRKPRFFDHRGANGVFIAGSLQAAEYAEALGRRADRLAAREPLASPVKAIEALREIPPPDGPPPIRRDNDLLALAVYASRNAALSSRLEIYPRGMSALRMVRLARGALAGVRELTARELRRTVCGRYPDGESLPDRPALDRLIDQVGLERIWRPDAARGRGAYCYKHGDLFSETSDSTFTHAGPGQAGKPAPGDGEFEAKLFDRKIVAAYKEGAFLVLTAPPRRLAASREALMARFDLKPVNFDALFIPALKKMAEEKEIRWQVVLDADAAPPDSLDGVNLRRLAALCIPGVREALSVSDKTILLTGVGLLARYGQLGLLEELRERVGGALEGLWILVPSGGRGQRPMVDDQPIPVLGSAQYAKIPAKWTEKKVI